MSNGGIIGTYNSGIWDAADISLERDKIKKGLLPRQGAHNKPIRYEYNNRRKFEDTIISLMHFNYPYTNEIGDGMRDEVGKLEWIKVGAAKFVGVEATVAQVVTDTPKFGWRCLQTATNTDYISATNSSGILNINKNTMFETDMFVRRTSETGGNILTLYKDGILTFSITLSPSAITVIGKGINVSSLIGPELSVWNHLLIKIYAGYCQIYMDGVILVNDTVTTGIIEADEIHLGGFIGQIDEFKMQMKSNGSAPIVPTQPYQSCIKANDLGGYGNGNRGDIVITGTNIDINTTAIIQNSSQQYFNIGTSAVGIYDVFAPNDKVMIHVSLNKSTDVTNAKDLGKFSIRRIRTIVGNDLALDLPIDEFNIDNRDYYYQIIKIPEFNTLLVDRDASIVPVAWNTTTGGGIVALNTRGNCTINGNITTTGKGIIRTDNKLFCHDQMHSEFLLTGNVFILCKETLTISGYIGGDWDGDAKGGEGGTTTGSTSASENGGNGGAGYGGGGAGAGNPPEASGISGVIGNGGRGSNGTSTYGNGVGGTGGLVCYNGKDGTRNNSATRGIGGFSGSSIIIISNKILIDKKSLSTGGVGGINGIYSTTLGGGGGGGGGGTGFCYIACNEMLEGDNTLTTIEPIRYAQDTVEF